MNDGMFYNSKSLRDIFESFTYGHGSLSLPVYIANYLFDIMASLFPLFVIMLLGVTSYKMLKYSDFKRQLREQTVYMSLIIIITYFAISIPGIHKYNDKSTYLIIDAYASVLKQGEDLADALTYSILYNGGTTGSIQFTSENRPKADTPLDGFFDNKDVVNSVLADNEISNAKKVNALQAYFEASKKSKDTLLKPYQVKNFETIGNIYYFIGRLNGNLGFRQKPMNYSDAIDGIKNPDDYLDNTYTIQFGDINKLGVYAEDIYNYNSDSFINYLKLSNFDYTKIDNKLIAPYDKALNNLLNAYINILKEQISRLKKYRTKAGIVNVPEELSVIDDYIYMLTASQNMYKFVLDYEVPYIYSDKNVINIKTYEKYFNDNKKNIKYFKAVFDMHKSALDSLLYSNKGSDLSGLIAIQSYVTSMDQYYKDKKILYEKGDKDNLTPPIIDPTDLNKVVMMYYRTLINFIPKANSAIAPNINKMIPDQGRKKYIYHSLAPIIPLMKKATILYSGDLTWREARNKISGGMDNAYTFYDQYKKTNETLAKALKSVEESKKVSLYSLSKEHLGENAVNKDREISWIDLGFFYTLLKNHYAEKMVLDSYIALEELNDAYLTQDSANLQQKIMRVNKASRYIRENNDYDKASKLIIVSSLAYGVAAGVSEIVENLTSIIKEVTKVASEGKTGGFFASIKSIFNGAKSIFKIGPTLLVAGGKAVFGFIVAYLIVSVLANLIFILLPSIIWMLAVIAWFFKTSVMIALLPINFFLIFFESKQQAVKSMLFNLVGQALVPVTMVAIFFIVMLFSSELTLMLDKFIPLLSGDILSFNGDGVASTIATTFDAVTAFITMILKTIILLVVNTQLYMQFFRADDYVSEVLGERVSYGQTISGGDVMSKLYVGRHV